MAVYTTIDNPELYFQIVLFSGNSSTQSITLGGEEDMQPDLVWIKARSDAGEHTLYDSVRGATKRLDSADNGAEDTVAGGVTAFNSDGFSVGSGGNENSATTIVGWCWKAGTAFSNDASATSVGSIDSAGTINTTAGISIIEYSGTGSQGTIAHGLSAKPKALWFKRLDTTGNWVNYHQSIGATKYLRFDTDSAQITASDEFNDTEPTTSVFTVDTDGAVNASGTDNHIVYCFAEKQGFSKAGSYIATGNTNGTFIYTGFRPAFVMTKLSSTSGGGWEIVDNKRDGYNGENNRLYPHVSDAEGSGNDYDLLSNGFKVRQSGGSQQSGRTNIYIAFAEQPFVNSNGVPCNAR